MSQGERGGRVREVLRRNDEVGRKVVARERERAECEGRESGLTSKKVRGMEREREREEYGSVVFFGAWRNSA